MTRSEFFDELIKRWKEQNGIKDEKPASSNEEIDSDDTKEKDLKKKQNEKQKRTKTKSSKKKRVRK